MSAPRLTHILETALYVGDLATSRDFYRRVMGFDVYREEERMIAMGVREFGTLLLFVRGGSAQPNPSPSGMIPAHDGRGTLHLAFAIPRGDLEAWASHLEREGIAIESRITWPAGGTSLYFRDPDGHSVEVATPGLWPNY